MLSGIHMLSDMSDTEDTKTKTRTICGFTDITASGCDGRKSKHNGHSIGYSTNFTARIETTAAPEKRWKPGCELETL